MSVEDVLKQMEGLRDLNLAYYQQVKEEMLDNDSYTESEVAALRDFKTSGSIYALCASMLSEALHDR